MADETNVYTRGRQDKRSGISRPNRRLDSLSLLLESNVTCAAIAIIHDKLYIAANDIYESQPKLKTQEFFQNVLSFLKDVATSGKTDSAAEILEEVVSKRAGISSAVARIIVPYILIGDGSVNAAKILKEHPEAEIPVDKLGQAIGWASVLINDLKKQVSFLKNQPEEAVKLAQALQELPVTIDNGKANVHAEMKLLGEIIEQIEGKKLSAGTELYIGISKLCCLKCACMLEAAQEVLSKQGINLQFGGEHDLEKNWEWHSPSGFPKDIFDNPELSSCTPLITEIVQKAKAIYVEKCKTKEEKGVNQGRDLSDSSGDDLDPALAHQQYLAEKIKALKRQQKVAGDSEKLQQRLTMLQLGVNLHNSATFKGLFYKAMPGVQDECMLAFNTIVSELFGEAPSLANKLQIFQFLKNSKFSGKLVSEYFQNFELPDADIKLQAPSQAPVTAPSAFCGALGSLAMGLDAMANVPVSSPSPVLPSGGPQNVKRQYSDVAKSPTADAASAPEPDKKKNKPE